MGGATQILDRWPGGTIALAQEHIVSQILSDAISSFKHSDLDINN